MKAHLRYSVLHFSQCHFIQTISNELPESEQELELEKQKTRICRRKKHTKTETRDTEAVRRRRDRLFIFFWTAVTFHFSKSLGFYFSLFINLSMPGFFGLLVISKSPQCQNEHSQIRSKWPECGQPEHSRYQQCGSRGIGTWAVLHSSHQLPLGQGEGVHRTRARRLSGWSPQSLLINTCLADEQSGGVDDRR